MTERSRGINSESASLSSLDDLERVDTSVKYQVTRVLGTLDENGLWTVLSCLSVYGIFLLETFNYEKLGGWDVLYRDDIAWYNLLFPISALQGVENVLNTIFIFELVARGYSVGFNRSFFLSPYTWVDALVCLPPLVSPDIDGLRLLRVLRVLRLLRLLDRRADSVLFGFIQTKETEVQLIGILAEFVCIFCITAGVIYDLEVQVNTDVNTLADCLYWSFLTLTGIGQPFEIVTPGGKVATVIAVCVALLVVPGQLAKLAAISGSQMISEMMEDEEDDSYDEDDDRAAVVASKPVTYTGALPGTIAGGMGSAAAQMVKNKVKKRYRRRLVDKRVCGTCELRSHDVDATFCRRCGAELGD